MHGKIYNEFTFQDCSSKWETRTGIKIYPKDMSTRHLQNSIRMVEGICDRNDLRATDYAIYNRMDEELMRRRLMI